MADPTPRITALLLRMGELQASDLFLSVGRRPHVRVLGEIRPLEEEPMEERDLEVFLEAHLPVGTAARLERELDVGAGISLPQGQRFRINLFHEKGRPALVARAMPSGALGFEDLGLPGVLGTLAEAPRGLLLITGAAGSGKSTTMAAVLHHINSRFARHIVTIEDPIEFVHRDLKSVVSQREVGRDTKSFAASLGQVVRQSPDAIFVAEVRDLETLQTAISAALTGHLVVATVQTPDVARTVERLINLFPGHLRDHVAGDLGCALVGVVSQRLLARRDGAGRVPACEILVGTPLAHQTIARRRFEEIADVLRAGAGDGMQTFTRSLVELYGRGLITAEAAAGAATNPDELLLAIQGMETGIDALRARSPGKAGSRLNIRNLLKAAVRHGASDLLLTTGKPPVLRIQGELKELDLPSLTPEVTRRLFLSILRPAQRVLFEADKEIDLALTLGSLTAGADATPHRFRVNGFYQKGAVGCAIRVVPGRLPPPEELGIPEGVMGFSTHKQGLLLVTGPTGHGKSTTLACLIERINTTRACHVVTVEDPIEYVHENRKAVIEQREVHADTRSFADALKHVLRQDPDVILVGEMRDRETVAAALTAAETGHLVLATLHTNDVSQTVDRVIDLFPPHQQAQVRAQLASCLLGVTSQLLLPRADGQGRIPAFEIMIATPPIRAQIRENRTFQIPSILETSGKLGMVSMNAAIERLRGLGLITRETASAWSRDRGGDRENTP